MSLDFFDSNGRPYAYTNGGENIYSFIGRPVAYISADYIYSFSGRHIGYFSDGMIRDRQGYVLLFTTDSAGGPMKPMRKMKPMKGMRQMRSMRPMKIQGWSSYSPESIFES